MKYICSSLILLVLMLVMSCSNDKRHKDKKCIDKHIGETRFTFSRYKTVDFMVSSGGYLVLYDYSIPVDTLFDYSGAQSIGKDSLLYIRIRRDLSESETYRDKNIYAGNCEGLYLYNGTNFRKLQLPYFHEHFSSFQVNGKDIYYWAFTKHFKIAAIKYNLETKKYVKQDMEIDAGTDFFAYFWKPFIYKNKVTFKTDSGEFYQYDLNLNLIQMKSINYELQEADSTIQDNWNS